MWIVLGTIGALAVAVLLFSVFQGLAPQTTTAAQPVAVVQLTLEADPAGTLVWIILADPAGRDAKLTGSFNLQVKEPDGATWTGTRNVTPRDFTQVPPGRLLAGRTAYQVFIPSTAWISPPRTGGTANLTVVVTRADGVTFTATSSAPFP